MQSSRKPNNSKQQTANMPIEKPADPRRVVGARVHTKASLTINDKECHRRYGSFWNTKLVAGTVYSIEPFHGRHYIQADWEHRDLDGALVTIVTACVNITQVNVGEPPH